MRPSLSILSTDISRRRVLGLALTAAGLALYGRSARAASGDRPTSSADAPLGSGGQSLKEGVVGKVVGPSGAPLAGVLVIPAPAGGGAGPVPELAVQTNAAGGFEWPLRPGRYRLDAFKGGRNVGSVMARVERGRLTTVTLRAGGSK